MAAIPGVAPALTATARRLALALLAALVLAGCATGRGPVTYQPPPNPPPSTPTPPEPSAPATPTAPSPPRPAREQKAERQQKARKPSAKATVETGEASWYGKAHQGRRTASGERYNMYELTAAHPRLPMGTRVLVTNVSNGLHVEVRINDRGPIVRGRIIDLSYAAARELDAVAEGAFEVRVRVLSGPPETTAPQSRLEDLRGSPATEHLSTALDSRPLQGLSAALDSRPPRRQRYAALDSRSRPA